MAFTKYDGSLHWHQASRYLGEDEHGTWLGGHQGTIARRGHEPAIEVGYRHVILVPPPDAWWLATFYAQPRECELYADICTPPRWPHEGEVTMVDLDLDVCRLRTGQQVQVLDEDEFAEHRVRYGYPADVIAAATESAAWLRQAISDHAKPFGGEHVSWLDLVE